MPLSDLSGFEIHAGDNPEYFGEEDLKLYQIYRHALECGETGEATGALAERDPCTLAQF